MEFKKEEALFDTGYKNGYDIEGDSPYSQWLAEFHPEAATSVELLQCTSTAVSYLMKHLSLSHVVEY